jgi:LmbE family N-acetylglucosaminyl deacetylase
MCRGACDSMVTDMPKLLCVVAHPDDETMLCGGTLALLAAGGVAVHILSLTRGEGGEVGEPPRCARAELGAVREQEMRCAVEKLGARTLTFLDYVDPEVGPDDMLFAPQADFNTLVGQIAEFIQRLAPEAVLTHGSNGEYGHPAHKLTHAATKQAVISLPALDGAAPLYSFSAMYPGHPYPRNANADDPADAVLDVAAFLDQKAAAALCHATQNALFVRRRSQRAGRRITVREALLTEEAVHRQWPAAPVVGDPFLRWLAGSRKA